MKHTRHIITALLLCTAALLSGCQSANSAASRLSFTDATGRTVGVELPKNFDSTKLDAGATFSADGSRSIWVKADTLKADASAPIKAAGDANAQALERGAAIGAAIADALSNVK